MLNESGNIKCSKSTAAEPTRQCPDIKYKCTINSNPNQFQTINAFKPKSRGNQF